VRAVAIKGCEICREGFKAAGISNIDGQGQMNDNITGNYIALAYPSTLPDCIESISCLEECLAIPSSISSPIGLGEIQFCPGLYET
jgi:hypothetical protein